MARQMVRLPAEMPGVVCRQPPQVRPGCRSPIAGRGFSDPPFFRFLIILPVAMTIKRHSVRCISGLALLGLFLGFVAISGHLGGYELEPNAGEVTLTAAVAEPLAFRNSTSPGFVPVFCLKAAGPCLLLALFGLATIIR